MHASTIWNAALSMSICPRCRPRRRKRPYDVRSGAASLTELSHFALPAILIPYPHAAEDHQTFNAKIFEREGAAALLQEREITGGMLAKKLLWFFDDPARLSEASKRSAGLAPKQAAGAVADTILKFCT